METDKPTGSSYTTMVDAELEHAKVHADGARAEISRVKAKTYLWGIAGFWATVAPPVALVVWLVIR